MEPRTRSAVLETCPACGKAFQRLIHHQANRGPYTACRRLYEEAQRRRLSEAVSAASAARSAEGMSDEGGAMRNWDFNLEDTEQGSQDFSAGAATQYGDDAGDVEFDRPQTTARPRREVFCQPFPTDGELPGPGHIFDVDTAQRDAHRAYVSRHAPDHDVEGQYGPFADGGDYRLASWLKKHRLSRGATDELLDILNIDFNVQPSFLNQRTLHKIIDNELAFALPKFEKKFVVVAEREVEYYFRDGLQCVKALYRSHVWADRLHLKPERHFTQDELRERLYSDMYTADWWWNMQHAIESLPGKNGATIIPVLLASDKTLLTQFRNKSAYPVYLTIGNIPKDIRKKPSQFAQVLVGYLPTEKLDHVAGDTRRSIATQDILHGCISKIIRSMARAGERGEMMTSGDGAIRRCHPILAGLVVDYPEQMALTGVLYRRCPTCTVHWDDLADSPCEQQAKNVVDRSVTDVVRVWDIHDNERDRLPFEEACAEIGMKAISHPFYVDLPYVNIFRCVTPDILHQLQQGVVKRLARWVIKLIGHEEIDARCRAIGRNHAIRYFRNGISGLSNISGTEHAQIAAILLGLLIGWEPSATQMQKADLSPRDAKKVAEQVCTVARSLLDILYTAQFLQMSESGTTFIERSIACYHTVKQIIIILGAADHLGFPKFHWMAHYPEQIRWLGASDNTNTQATERLHIDYAKQAYDATNGKNELQQMVVWIERKEKMHQLRVEVETPLALTSKGHYWHPPDFVAELHCKTTKNPSIRRQLSIEDIVTTYQAAEFPRALKKLQLHITNPRISGRALNDHIADMQLPHLRFRSFHKLKFLHPDDEGTVYDSVTAQPSSVSRARTQMPQRFDPVVVRSNSAGQIGYRIARVKIMFEFSPSTKSNFTPEFRDHPLAKSKLAYVEWYTKLHTRDPVTRLFKIAPSLDAFGHPDVDIISVNDFAMSAHLLPAFDSFDFRLSSPETVLNDSPHFYLNSYKDRISYFIFNDFK